MADIATTWDVSSGTGDWTFSAASISLWTDENGNSIVDESGNPVDGIFTAGQGLVAGTDLVTAVLISLFTDAAAGPDDVIPDGSGDPRGWWGGPVGSKLWLRERSKQTPTLLALVKNDIEQALQWLIDAGAVATVNVTTEFPQPGRFGAVVEILRQDGARVALNFSDLWESL